MAITRKQYITVAELNEVLGTTYADDATNNLAIKEASELISYHTNTRSDVLFEATNPNVEQLDNLKIGTAYQVQYVFDNQFIDDDYEDVNDSISLGRYSTSSSGGSSTAGASKEWKKVAPKTNRYLLLANLRYTGLSYRSGSGGLCLD